jgi:UPF0755 protein
MILKAARAAIAAALFVFLALTAWVTTELTTPWGGPGPSVLLEVEKGTTAAAAARHLERQRVIRSATALTLAYKLFYSEERLKAGEYDFALPIRAKDAFFMIFKGRVALHPLTIPEGLTGEETAAVVAARTSDGLEAFRAAFRDADLVADLDPAATDLEGYLFPDTYHVPRSETAAELVSAMVAQFKKEFNPEWRRRAAELGMNIRQVVTLASLIEKETGRPEERPLVSAVFHNRLRLGMKLDCDPTVIYALKLRDVYSGRLLARDLEFPSPYNTYLHPGLPPGPICNPGARAMEAALEPAHVEYLYFVAQSDGSHHFSRSFGEHQEAVRRFLLKKK